MTALALVVDVGSRGGLHPRWKRVADRITVVAFDADRGADAPRSTYPIEYRTGALSDTTREATLYLTRKPACSSLFHPNRELLDHFPESERYDVVKEIPIETRPLTSFGMDPDFLKLDTQGSELDILKGAPLDGAIGLEVEVEFVPLYTGQPLFADINWWLVGSGFVLVDVTREYWRRSSGSWQLVFGDALYLRDRDSLDTGQQRKLDTIERAYGYGEKRRFVRGANRISRWLAQYTRKGWYYADDGLGL